VKVFEDTCTFCYTILVISCQTSSLEKGTKTNQAGVTHGFGAKEQYHNFCTQSEAHRDIDSNGSGNCPIRANCFENALKQMFQRSFSAKVKIGSKLFAFKRSESFHTFILDLKSYRTLTTVEFHSH